MKQNVAERYHVFAFMMEFNEAYADAQEAGEAIAALIEYEGLGEDDIYVVKGVEITLSVTERKASTVSFDGKEVYGESEIKREGRKLDGKFLSEASENR